MTALLLAAPALAVDSVWLENPANNIYNAPVNWDTNPLAPVNAGDTATFGQSTVNGIGFLADVDVDTWIFNAVAENYTFVLDQQLVFLGEGIVVNGGGAIILNAAGSQLHFRNDSSAGDAAISHGGILLAFHDNSTAGSADIINGGVMNFNGSSSAGSATIDNTDLIFFGETSTAGNAAITNPTGTIVFVSSSTAGDAAIENGNMMQFAVNSTAGNASILNVGTLEFSGSSTAGSAAVENNLVTALYDDSSAGNAQIRNNFSLSFSDNSTAGNAVIESNDFLTFLNNSSAGNALIDNGAILQFIDDSSAGNAIIINDDTATFENNSTGADATITNNNLLQVVDNATLGNARLINNAGATLDIAALVGGNVTAGSIEGGGQIDLGNSNNNLYVGQNDLSTEYSGVITGGNGSLLVKLGDGILTLSGTSLYAGDINVGIGGLMVNGSIASADVVQVFNGAMLGGTGTVTGTIAHNGGRVAPGNSIGTLNVAGDVIFNPDSIYEVEVNSAGQSDLLDVTGIATLNGGTVEVIPFPDFAIDTQYTILTAAGGVGGAFDGTETALGSIFLTPDLTYGPNDVFLTIAQTADFGSVALTPNQIAAAGGAQSLGGGDLFNAIAALGTAQEAQDAFDAISGEIHASAKTALIEDSRFVREAANGRLRTADEGQGAWVQAFGATGHTDGDGNAAALDRATGGLFVGADGQFAEDWQAGVLAGYSRSGFDVDDRASSGSANSYHLGAYGGTTWEDFAFRFGGAYSWHDLEISRTAAFTGFSDTLASSYSAGTGQVFGELAYGMEAGDARFEPFANLAWVRHATSGFTEDGGAAALTGAGDVINTTFATLGLRASTDLPVAEAGTARLTGMAGWRHAFGDVPTATNTFVAGGNGFTVAGVPIAQDALVLEAGLEMDLAPEATLGVLYSGQIGSGVSDHSIKANFGVRF